MENSLPQAINTSAVSAAELQALREMSQKLGQDITRTQGAGGNTSIKRDGLMWVKASGTWLANALDQDIMVPVATVPLLEAVAKRDPSAEKATDFVVESLNSSKLRPSIETSVHAVIRHPVVAHFHCVNTLARAVQSDAETAIGALIAEKLPQLTWAFIPYRRPGIPLAEEIAKTADSVPDILVLQNHGIVIGGESVAEIAERIETVTAALAMPRRMPSSPDIAWLEKAAIGGDYKLPADVRTHDIALDATGLGVALGGSLYPDHVIFLGEKIGVLAEGQALSDLLAAARRAGEALPKLIVAPGRGVLLSKSLTPGGETMARCLAEVVTRVPPGASIVYLTHEQEHILSNWEAEQYRQTLDQNAARR
jgi:rhamnose utilization protein RhaD (predicted bifunctional aldolase and dehydrogenase)